MQGYIKLGDFDCDGWVHGFTIARPSNGGTTTSASVEDWKRSFEVDFGPEAWRLRGELTRSAFFKASRRTLRENRRKW